MFCRRRGFKPAPQTPCFRVQERQSHPLRRRQSGHWAASLRAALLCPLALLQPLCSWSAIEAEVNTYLMTTTIDGEEDPLAWWKVHRVNFPMLSKLVSKFLCIPATSSPSERVFSAGGNVVTCQRSCLKPAKVDMLVFLTKNL